MLPRQILIFVDIECGGLFDVNAGVAEVINPLTQLAAIAVDSACRELETFEVKLQFRESDANWTALKINHYDRQVWQAEAVPPKDGARQFAAFMRRHATIDRISRQGERYRLAQLVAHNAERFDGPLIHAWYWTLGQYCPAALSAFCTKQRAYWLFQEDKSLTPPPDFKLRTLCDYFGVSPRAADAHDALNDVRATVSLYRKMAQYQASCCHDLSKVKR